MVVTSHQRFIARKGGIWSQNTFLQTNQALHNLEDGPRRIGSHDRPIE